MSCVANAQKLLDVDTIAVDRLGFVYRDSSQFGSFPGGGHCTILPSPRFSLIIHDTHAQLWLRIFWGCVVCSCTHIRILTLSQAQELNPW